MDERSYSELPLLDPQGRSSIPSGRIKTKSKSYLRLSPWTSWKRRFVVFLTLALIALLTILWWIDVDRTESASRLQKSDGRKKHASKKPLAQENMLSKPGESVDRGLRYLSYLPHSGFHNQRIALENALTLAKVLNRTLIIPPCILGTAIPWVEFDKLLNRLRTISSIGFDDCYSEDTEQMVSPRECSSQPHGTFVDWKEIIDMDEIRKSVNVIERKSFEEDWLFNILGIKNPADKIQQIKEEKIYQYKFLIRPGRKKAGKKVVEQKVELGKFDSSVDVYQHFGNSDASLIEIGSLFGTSRLKISNDPLARQARSGFRRAMVFNNPVLLKLSRRIASQLFHPPIGYLGVHVRVGDNLFRSHATETVSTIISKLLTDHLKLPLSSLQEAILESDLQDRRRQPELISSDRLQMTCRRPKFTKPHLLKFNRPLFLATDSPLPEVEPALATFFKAFPCTYLLNDFDLLLMKDITLSQDRQVRSNPEIGKLMVPFLDAMVAARATSFVGTPGSTFSDFVNNVLFQTYHNLPIIEFG
ncbi:hypothetical protein PtA15_8A20 [Puccinia triticina]|uniref:O-fucosyltransferase family protein n=1 Tax=Puccinia triticina TaxID=208348 RepID=A0ABY7CPD9_9BASI|nr:uncharacterized protein PtA15_8A20 [Puccinia triticina]WAQ87119.1 hypothetical protein PtA15_8A20 [Puccinia triticina]WAR56978.1 hypothetical protein PtB15_8B22 [Puccinia triticina]